jgi:hypothetical protein
MPNHLQQVEITTTTPRQTPKQGFADVMGQAAATAVSVGADLIAPVASSSPLLSAAVSAVKAVAQGAIAQSTGAATAGAGGSSDPASMMRESAEQNMKYLILQRDMQQQSQEFSTLSNVMKVHSDSAKAAINNIR